MTTDLINNTNNFIDADDQYLVIIASCICKKIDPKKEPILNSVIEKYPYANIYESNDKRVPGTFKIVGDGIKKRKIILIFGQIYPSKMDYPQDNKNKRLEWFIQALDKIAEIEDLKSICFPTQIARDGGGNWSYYYMAIKEFAQTLHLTSKIPVVIYQNKIVDSDSQIIQTQVSLLNCINLNSSVSLDSICIASNQKKINIFNDVLPLNPKKLQSKKILLNTDKLKTTTSSDNVNNQNINDLINNVNFDNVIINNDEMTDENDDLYNESNHQEELENLNINQENFKEDPKEDPIETPKEDLKEDLKKESKEGPKEEKLSFKSKKKVTSKETNESNKEMVKKEDKEMFNKFPETMMNSDWSNKTFNDLIYDKSWEILFSMSDIQTKLSYTNNLLVAELNKLGDKSRILPDFNLILNAFILCPYDQMKVVILGQDPYVNPEHAMGLSFSVPSKAKIAQSLANIFKEIKREYDEYKIPDHGNLENWAKQGVLLINSALTVREGERNSQQSLWNETTDLMIKKISELKVKDKQPVVFMLWGGDAKKKKSLIDSKFHLVLEAGHPSPLSVKFFENCGHFKTCNKKLISCGMNAIDWQT